MQKQGLQAGLGNVHVAQFEARGLRRVDDGPDQRAAAIGVHDRTDAGPAERTSVTPGSFCSSASSSSGDAVEAQAQQVAARNRSPSVPRACPAR